MFKKFRIAVGIAKPDDTVVLLVDSEGPVESGVGSVEHLTRRDRWSFPEVSNHKIFMMVQAMEAWLLADRDVLANYYGDGFHRNALPGVESDVEAIPKDDLVPSLQRASRDTQKRAYHKTRHAFDILARIEPRKVEQGSPHAAEFNEFLRKL